MGQDPGKIRIDRARAFEAKGPSCFLLSIRAGHEALGQHLDSAIRTGTYCSYQPDPRVPTQWDVSG